MITHSDGLFCIETENTQYIFSVEDTGYPVHIYYGKKLRDAASSILGIKEKHLKAPHMSTIAERRYREFSLNDTLLEFSTEGKGDYKIPQVALSRGEKGDRTLALEYSSYQISPGIIRFRKAKMPQAIAGEEDSQTLSVSYIDSERKIKLTTYYTAFYKADVITRRVAVYNESGETVTLRSVLSSTLDLRAGGCTVTSFSGAWGREKGEKTRSMTEGEFRVESRTIQSGEADATIIVENGRDTYLSSLIYSGAVRTSVSETTNGITHITTGINPDLFSWRLTPGDYFESPEAVLIHTLNGKVHAGNIMKKFIENHIRRGLWKNRMKPVMLNTWDALQYDPDESEVLKMAREAKELGIEGICIDDGWFGARSDSTSSLGDWYPDTRHFPSGIKDLANEVHYLGLLFGLWFEIEGISERSMLYKSHPDWIVGRKASSSAVSNDELLLDISRSDVQDWAIDTLTRIIESANIDYIRWSLSRFQGELWSNRGDEDAGEFMHRYVLGLYHILDTITKIFPNLYIEAASSGGMRFDMGMLSYASSILSSECSDPVVKIPVTEAEAAIYPLSVTTNVISSSPDKYTGRSSDRETRFNTAVFGVLNYSINPHELSKMEKFILKEQIEFYKAYRPLFQYGTFTKEEDNEERAVWSVSNGDASAVIMLYYMKKAGINTSAEKLYSSVVNPDYDYSFTARNHFQDKIELILKPQEIECYNIGGDALKWAGLSLADNISGNGWEDGMRTLCDNSSRLYIIRKKVQK